MPGTRRRPTELAPVWLIGLSLGLAACQSAREADAPTVARPPATAAPQVYAEVALSAMLDPADSRLGAAGKPSPALRYRSRPATESALAVRGGVAPAVEPSAAVPAPRIPSTGVEAPVARVPAEASAAAVKGSLPRYAPPRAPHGSTYRPRPPDGELSARFYDRSSPSFALLQRPGDAMRGLPADTAGGVDWVQALQQEAIAPRASLAGADRMELLDSDVVMRDTASMPWVLFPHRRHTEWLACSNCHPAPFEPRSGANDIRMDDILRGRWCGQCHDRVAFPTLACERCHNVLHEGSPDAWWERRVGKP